MVGKNNLVSIVIHHCQGMIEFEADGFRKIYFNCMCLSVLLRCMFICALCVFLVPVEATRSPGPEVIDSCKSPSGC